MSKAREFISDFIVNSNLIAQESRALNAKARDELNRLEAIEKAVIDLIKQTGNKGLANALAAALNIELPCIGNSEDPEPFGYFRCNSFGWEDCREDDEGAIALYEHPPISKVIRPHAEALLQQALKVLVYHTKQTRPIDQTEKMIATLQAHCTPQRAKQEQPRPSAIELQDSEIGIPEPVTELINPA